MARVRYGVIGLGWFEEKHCEALAGIPNVELYALCTRTEARLKELAATFGVRKIHTDYRQMLADPDLEAVSIVTMWDQHLLQEVHPSLSIGDRDGWRSPDTTYWPFLHGLRAGALRDELAYFVTCVEQGRQPSVIAPEESREAVRACLAAEESARTGEIVRL